MKKIFLSLILAQGLMAAPKYSKLQLRNMTDMETICDAIRDKNISEIERILDDRVYNELAAVDIVDSNGITPLHTAAYNGNINIARLLIDSDVNVNAADENGVTPLHVATHNGHVKLCRLLINRGANIDAAITKDGKTVLHVAAFLGNLSMINLLIDENADVNAKDMEGWTPIYGASENGYIEIVRFLIDRGANINISDSYYDETPLHRPASADFEIKRHSTAIVNHIEVTKLLMEKGADVNAQDIVGNTPLHRAAYHGYIGIATALIENPLCNHEIKNYSNKTPEDIARSNGHTNIVEIINSYRIRVNPLVSNVDEPGPSGYHSGSDVSSIATEDLEGDL